ncbi:WXG100 family type VII secretion target [Streptomyces sp. NPDC019224]|uniref:WXG100 family type VII secretion target n=1 Tax=Streptomyces sp. NPDC019224 TaxID=3154484 RepID=UPI0033ED20CA
MTGIEDSRILVHADLSTAGPEINRRAAEISEELSLLIRQLQPLAATWTGEAKEYYEVLQAEWNMAAEGLFGPEGVLGRIAHALNVNWANYSNAEWANVSTWRTRN